MEQGSGVRIDQPLFIIRSSKNGQGTISVQIEECIIGISNTRNQRVSVSTRSIGIIRIGG